MTEIQEKRLAFLDETVKYYSEDVTRRAVMAGDCLYRTDDGKKCAIGRFILDKDYRTTYEGNSVQGVFDILPIEIQNLGEVFLDSVQGLHDSEINWDENGLTETGISSYERIKNIYIY